MRKKPTLIFVILLFLIPFVSADAFDGNNVTLITTEDLATTVNSLIDPYGITTNGTGSSPDTIYIMDNNAATLWGINSTFNNKTGGDSLTSFFIGIPDDLWSNGTDFWIINDDDDFVYHVNSTFDNQTDGFSTPSGANADGLSGNSSNLFLVPSTSSSIRVYDHSGNNVYNITCTTDVQHCNNVESITYFDGFFYLLDSTEDIHKINSSGATVSSRSVDNIGGGIVASGNLNSLTTTNGNDFWLIDRSQAGREIYHVTYNDSTPPIVNVTFPVNGTSYDASVTELNYTVSDNGILSTCWYTLDEGTTNTTITCGINVTGLDSGEGEDINWTVYSNDSFGLESSSTSTFSVSFQFQSLSLDSPGNNSFLSSGINIDFNYTAIDPNGVDTCSLYGDWSGGWHLNLSDSSITSGVQSNFQQSIVDGNYIWNVFCNDTTNQGTFNETNFTFTVDTTLPVISASNIDIVTSQGSQTVSINITSITEVNCDSIWYTVRDSAGLIENSIENVSFQSCTNRSDSFTVNDIPPEDYNLTIFINDSAGNENSTTVPFSTAQIVTPPSLPGGGSSGPIEVEGKNVSWTLQTENGGGSYSLIMSGGQSRTLVLQFINRGENPVNIVLGCAGLNCKFVSFEKSTFILPPSLIGSITEVEFTIDLSDEVNNNFEINIIATDQEGNEAPLPVAVSVGFFGNIAGFIDKLISNVKIFGITLPAIFVGLLFSVFMFATGSLFLFKKLDIRILLSLLSSVFIFVITIIFV